MAAETPNPSFFEIDLKRRLLFAVNEVDDGSVSAFATDPATGKLTLLNKQPSKGKSPCHLALGPDGRNLLVTNCGSGSVAVLPVAADGKLGEATDVVQPAGEGGRVQGVTLDPAGRFAFVGAPGLDKVMSYRLDAAKGKLTPNEPAFVATGEKTGPRQLAFRPDGKFAYVINELNSTISAFAYDAETGALTELQNLSTVPGYFDGANITADIQMHSSGKYVFVSNDGHNSVVLFTIDKDKGELNWVEEQGTGGVAPRHFGIEPSGGHLAISNQGSDKVLASRIDGGNGRLKPSGIFAEMPSPACVRFLPPVGSAEKPTGEN
jgi:6-phosphogluconolactonase